MTTSTNHVPQKTRQNSLSRHSAL